MWKRYAANALIATLVIAIVVLMTISYKKREAPKEATLTAAPTTPALAPFALDLTALSAARAARFPSLDAALQEPSSTDSERLFLDLMRFRGLALSAQWPINDSHQFTSLQRALGKAARDVSLSGQRPEALRAAFERHRTHFLKTLQRYSRAHQQRSALSSLSLERDSAARLSAQLSSQAVAQSVATIAHDLPRFVSTVAVPEGFVSSRDYALNPSTLPLLEILWMHYWIEILRPNIERGALLTRPEEITLRRWQIERSLAPLDRKIALARVQRAALLPEYDPALAEGILLYQAGRHAEAEQAWLKAKLQAALQGDTSTSAKLQGWLTLLASDL